MNHALGFANHADFEYSVAAHKRIWEPLGFTQCTSQACGLFRGSGGSGADNYKLLGAARNIVQKQTQVWLVALFDTHCAKSAHTHTHTLSLSLSLYIYIYI